LNTGFKLAALSAIVSPFQKAFAAGSAMITTAKKKFHQFLWIDKLVLNTKTKVVHLPSGKIFSKYPTIRRQAIIGNANWEIEVKPPYHFHKEKSGIILEVLALSRLASGINDRSLTDAYRILSIAFTGTYRSKTAIIFNKYNFRLHHLLLKVISLNNTYPSAEKWNKFRLATANINYSLDKKPLPKFVDWIKSKPEFDKKVNYIVQNRSDYTSRLAKRASRYK
jgi:hypothetical protein